MAAGLLRLFRMATSGTHTATSMPSRSSDNAIALIRPGTEGRIAVRQYGAQLGIHESDTLDVDQDGRLWRSSDQIYVANATQAEAANWLQLNRSDGFPADDMNSGSLLVDSDGSLWWGADNDLAHYTPPRDLVSPEFVPQVFISAFSLGNQAPKLAEAVSIVPNGSKLVAHIGSLQFDRRSALRLRYRLLPDQPSWHEAANLDLALGAPSHGPHTLEVQGRIFTGPWSPAVSRSFKVLRPTWLAWPIVALYFVTAATLITVDYLLHRRWQAEEAQVLPDLTPWLRGALPEVHQITGTLLDSRFTVGNLLARGGFANVMRGYDHTQKQPCAIKIFRTQVKSKAWIHRSFDQEVAALQKVRHPNVVSIYAYGHTPSGVPYLVMEFVEGRNLREIVEDGPLPARRTGRLLGQLASALDAIHAEAICHRDLKPENVIVRNTGSPEEESVLIDFSIAIIKDADETLHGLSRAAGTFDYMAPEQAVGYAQTSSDIYSLARVAIEMLTGRPLRDLLPGAGIDLPDRVRDLIKSLGLPLSHESIEMLASSLEFDPTRRPNVASRFAGPLVRDLESN
jgi:tRNA A-37 threonylcarbamoyl transferase component Bud32